MLFPFIIDEVKGRRFFKAVQHLETFRLDCLIQVGQHLQETLAIGKRNNHILYMTSLILSDTLKHRNCIGGNLFLFPLVIGHCLLI